MHFQLLQEQYLVFEHWLLSVVYHYFPTINAKLGENEKYQYLMRWSNLCHDMIRQMYLKNLKTKRRKTGFSRLFRSGKLKESGLVQTILLSLAFHQRNLTYPPSILLFASSIPFRETWS